MKVNKYRLFWKYLFKICVRTQKGITFALVKMKQEILSMRDEKSYKYKKDEKSQVQEMEGFR